jgi:hypothetical protein
MLPGHCRGFLARNGELLDFQIFFFNIGQARPIIVLRQNPEHGVAMRKPTGIQYLYRSLKQGKPVERRRRKVTGLKSSRPRRLGYQKARATVNRNVGILHTFGRTKLIFQSSPAACCQAQSQSAAFPGSLTLIVSAGARS